MFTAYNVFNWILVTHLLDYFCSFFFFSCFSMTESESALYTLCAKILDICLANIFFPSGFYTKQTLLSAERNSSFIFFSFLWYTLASSLRKSLIALESQRLYTGFIFTKCHKFMFKFTSINTI